MRKMSKNNHKFSVPPVRINFEVIDTEQFQPKVQSRCHITKMRGASFDQVVEGMNQMCQKFGMPYTIQKVRRD